MSRVGYTRGELLFNFKQALKFCSSAGMRVTLSCLGRAVEGALKLQFLHVLQASTAHQAPQHEKKARAPQLFCVRGEGLFHLGGFPFRNALSAIQGIYSLMFTHFWFMVFGPLRYCYQKKKTKTPPKKTQRSPFSFPASPSVYEHKGFSDPWNNSSFWHNQLVGKLNKALSQISNKDMGGTKRKKRKKKS